MAINVKHFIELFNYRFNIPSYQRGYRWEEKQITDLLCDLVEFRNSSGESKSFYCLQPVVVTRNKELTGKNGHDIYDLIDGQQRLTTLRLIFNKIGDMLPEELYSKIYSIDYERKDTPIDDYFIEQANATIDNWFKKKGALIKAQVAEVLCPEAAQISYLNQEEYPEDCHDVRVIWYDIDEDTKQLYGTNMESVDIFNRLNYGKTGLTSTELIKALFFQCDQYPDAEKPLRRQLAFSRSCEWDIMEKNLQNPYLWGMLGTADYDSHIDLILSFVVRRLLDDNPMLAKDVNDDKDYNYRVINNYIGSNQKRWSYNIDQLWLMLQDSYVVITNWYNNQQWYHLIGLCITLKKLKEKKTKGKDYANLIFDIYKLYIKEPKSKFTRQLKMIIGKEVRINSQIGEKSIMYKSESDKGRVYRLDEICYNECNQDLIRILLLYNVDVSLHSTNERLNFPFHLFDKCKTTSLEHIHPQNLSLDDIKFDELCRWYHRKEEELERIGKLSQMKEPLLILKNAEKEQESNSKWFDEKENHALCQKAVTSIDVFFNELAKIDETLMHTICNMALVDKDTNAALQNYLLDKKRSILKERENHDPESPVFIPIATKMVFNKEFNNSPKDLQYWTEKDRKDYFAEIKRVYDEYTNII